MAKSNDDVAGSSYSVVSREQRSTLSALLISIRRACVGPTRAKVFLPLTLAESLHVMQPTDLREISRAASDQSVYSSISVRVKNPTQVQPLKMP